jgi:hypothetical protein
LLSLILIAGASAHRLDEYLQATLIGMSPNGTDVEINLTPGVAMLPLLMAVIDRNGDGKISSEEWQAYVDRVAGEVELRVDGAPAPLSLIESEFPTLEAMYEGLGTIRMKLRTPRSGHELRFENRHLPQISVYLVNCLTSLNDHLVVKRQQRDEAQKSINVEYSFNAEPRPFWPVALGLLLLARVALLTRTRGGSRGKPDLHPRPL